MIYQDAYEEFESDIATGDDLRAFKRRAERGWRNPAWPWIILLALFAMIGAVWMV